MKLTPELIGNARQYINPVKDRELDLRGYKIPNIENMGASHDQFDTIDFCDNDLKRLENFPHLARLKCLLMSNNRISYVDLKLGDSVPNINTINLSNNSFQELGDLTGLATLRKLEHLSLIGNPVAHKSHYRLYLIHKIPSLRVLDFRRIKLKDRQAADKMFKGESGAALKKQVVKKSKTFNVGEVPDQAKKLVVNGSVKSSEELKAIQEAIMNAKSLDEINHLQEMLQSGTFSVKSSTPAPNGDAASGDVEMDE